VCNASPGRFCSILQQCVPFHPRLDFKLHFSIEISVATRTVAGAHVGSSGDQLPANTPFVCQDCGLRWKCRSGLISHRWNHHTIRPYICAVCGSPFAKQTGLRKHVANAHGNCGSGLDLDPGTITIQQPSPDSCDTKPNTVKLKESNLKRRRVESREIQVQPVHHEGAVSTSGPASGASEGKRCLQAGHIGVIKIDATVQTLLHEMHRQYGGSVLGMATGLSHVCRHCPFGTSSLLEFESHQHAAHPFTAEVIATELHVDHDRHLTVDEYPLPPFLLHRQIHNDPAIDVVEQPGEPSSLFHVAENNVSSSE
jgi:hypothetical protein